MRHILAASTALLLAGCQTFPEKHAVENQRTYPLTREAVWSDVLAWLDASPLSIGKVNEAAGTIQASAVYPGGSGGNADCGVDNYSPKIERRQLVTVNVFPSAGGTSVNVVSTVREDRRNDWDLSTFTIDCQSTGVLEASLLDSIH